MNARERWGDAYPKGSLVYDGFPVPETEKKPEPPQWARSAAAEVIHYLKNGLGHRLTEDDKEIEVAELIMDMAKKRMTVDAALATIPVCNFSLDREKEQVVLDTTDRTYYANTAQHCLEQLERDIQSSNKP